MMSMLLFLLFGLASGLQLSIDVDADEGQEAASALGAIGEDDGPISAAMRLVGAGGNDRPIHFVSLNTEGRTALEEYGFPGVVENVGKGIEWQGYGTKLVNIMYYAATLPPDDLLVYVDGNDVIWGGCSKREFLSSYEKISRASGAKVIVGAEMVCGEQSCDNTTTFPRWALERASQTTVESFVRSRLTECEDQVKSECRCDMPSEPNCRSFNYTGVDDADWLANRQRAASLLSLQNQRNADKNVAPGPLFRYLNSGFVMGPAKHVKDMFEWSVFHYLSIKDHRSWMHDQGAIAEYWRMHPDLVALDYRGELSLQLPRLAADVLELGESAKSSGGRVVHNKLMGGGVQCFVHNNINEWNGGPRASYWWDFFKTIKVDAHDWDN